MYIDNITKNIIDNIEKSDNLLETGIGNVGLLKYIQKYGSNMEEVEQKYIIYVLIYSLKMTIECRNMSGHSRWAVQPLDWRLWYSKINSYVVVVLYAKDDDFPCNGCYFLVYVIRRP